MSSGRVADHLGGAVVPVGSSGREKLRGTRAGISLTYSVTALRYSGG